MDEKRQRISEKAYFQWEREGRPEGREQDHWLQAEGELQQDAKQTKPKKTARPRAAKAAKKATKKKTKTGKRAVKKRAK